METQKSLELIEAMFKESKKSFCRNSFYFIFWGFILAAAGLTEYFMRGMENHWIVWPIITTIGGIVSMVQGIREGKRQNVVTIGDRVVMLIWLGFVAALVYAIVFSLFHHMTPHAFVMLVTAYATFLTGGVSKFKPLLWGSLALFIGAVLAGFVIPMKEQGLLFAVAITLGYVIPGILLRRSENGEA